MGFSRNSLEIREFMKERGSRMTLPLGCGVKDGCFSGDGGRR